MPLIDIPTAPWISILIIALIAAAVHRLLDSLSPAAGWGPGLHIRFSRGVIERLRSRSRPNRDQEVVLAHPEHFYYGNIAADIINFKRYGGMKNHCHNWNIQERLEALAGTDTERAFLLGYLCHLAADITAHNHFIPFHLVLNLPPRYLGHPYWEALADATVADEDWDVIAAIKRNRTIARNDHLVHRAVRWKALGMRSNKWIFNNILLLNLRRSWREVVRLAHQREKRFPLRLAFFKDCADRSAADMMAIFDQTRLLHLKLRDPTGRSALRAALRIRRNLKRSYPQLAVARQLSVEIAYSAYGELGHTPT